MEKEKSNKKFVYIAIIVMLLLFFFVFAFLNREKLKTETKEKEYDTVLIIGNTIFQKTNNYWNSVTNEENIIKLVNWKKYKIYTDYKYFGEYNLVNAETWLAFDDKRNPIELPGIESSFFAYKSNENYDIKSIKLEENKNLEETKKVLKEFNININYLPEVNISTNLDLNNDGVEDKVYAITNMLTEYASEPEFSIFIVKRGNKLYRLFKSSSESNSTNMCYPNINSILDIDNDNEYEIIMSCTNTGIDSIKTIMYKYNEEKDDYQIVISD